jgi:hypothetical protein
MAMNITFACPTCHGATRSEFTADTGLLRCDHCGQEIKIPPQSVRAEAVERCLVCPSTDLFVRKDFPQRVGVGLVALGVVGSSIAWYYTSLLWTFGILFGTALVDVLLYALVGNALMCYRCGAHYRGVAQMHTHGQFNLETHEKHRQIEARLG